MTYYYQPGLESSMKYQYRYEFSGNFIVYEGIAIPTAKDADHLWIVKKYFNDGTNVTKIRFADESVGFNKSWAERESYSY